MADRPRLATLKKAFIAALALFVVALVVAMSPLAEGEEGTTQDAVGDVVWSVLFITFPLALILGIAFLLKQRSATR